MKHLIRSGYWILSLLLFAICPIHADVVITELMPCNTSTYINDLWDYVGYAELYNDGSDDVDLNGYSFVNTKKNGTVKWTWKIDSTCVVKSKQYLMIFFDEVTGHQYHVGYKLDTDGGVLKLMKGSSAVSSMKYTQQYPHISYGVDANGTVGYMEPSPMEDNTTAYTSIKSRCAKPKFSDEPGVRKDAMSIELTCETDSVDIYYTTNGDIPVPGVSKKYTEPITSKYTTTVIRAIAVKEGMLKSEIATGSYIYNDPYHYKCNGMDDVKLVSVVTDRKFFYDDMQGIYTQGTNGTSSPTIGCNAGPKNFFQNWTRGVNVEYMIDSVLVLSQEVETSVKGACSRLSTTKSLSFKANKKSGKKGFDYIFFPEQRPGIQYNTIHLRNGGNAYSSVQFRDGFMSSIANGLGLDCQSYEPVSGYINGSYMGMMGLRSPANKAYVEAHYGLDEDEIDFLKIHYVVDAMAGDTVAYNKLVATVTENDPSSEDYYSNAAKLMDMKNYIDYNIFEQYIVNPDWPGNNQKLWREHNGGKFRWMLYDLDMGFGMYASTENNKDCSNVETDMLDFVLGNPKKAQNKEAWMSIPFSKLLKNDEFKYRFLTRYMHHLKYSFTEEFIDSVWYSIVDKVADEYCASKGRVADEDYLTMKKFALGRHAYIYDQLKTHYDAGKKVSMQVVVKDDSGKRIPNSGILVNNEALGVTDYSVDYYAGIPLKVELKVPAGYKFKNWTFSSSVTDAGKTPTATQLFEGKLTADIKMTAVFTKESDPQPLTLQINEVCASNTSAAGNPDECGHYSDWIEIYNYGKEDLDLAGMFITDDSADTTKYMFPYGSADTKIPAGKCIVVWADDEPWRGALHTNFKVSSSGSFVGLTYNLQNQVTYLDSVTCPKIPTDETYGRIEDGEDWGHFSTVDGESQVTFGKPNRPVSDTTAVVQPVSIDNAIVVYPNPAHDEITVASVGQNSKILSLAVYNAQGVLLRTIANVNQSAYSLATASLAPGMYIIKAETNYAVTHKRFEKQ